MISLRKELQTLRKELVGEIVTCLSYLLRFYRADVGLLADVFFCGREMGLLRMPCY